MADDQPEIEDVERRVKEIQARHGGRMRWHVSKHTAELAIGALDPPPKRARRRFGKSRRRKRFKRLL